MQHLTGGLALLAGMLELLYFEARRVPDDNLRRGQCKTAEKGGAARAAEPVSRAQADACEGPRRHMEDVVAGVGVLLEGAHCLFWAASCGPNSCHQFVF